MIPISRFLKKFFLISIVSAFGSLPLWSARNDLLQAIKEGNLRNVETIIANAKLHDKTCQTNTLSDILQNTVSRAVKYASDDSSTDSFKIVEELLRNGATFECYGGRFTTVSYAVMGKKPNLLKLLIVNYAGVRELEEQYAACRFKIMRHYDRCEADPNYVDQLEIIKEYRHSQLRKVRQDYEEHISNKYHDLLDRFSIVDGGLYSNLWYALEHQQKPLDFKDKAIVDTLLDWGADINQLLDGKSYLYRVVEDFDLYLTQQLIDLGADPTIPCQTDHKLIMSGWLDDGRLPAEKAALHVWNCRGDENLVDQEGGALTLVKMLLDAQGGINESVEKNGNTLLHRAVRRMVGSLTRVYLSQFNADPNVENASGKRPLDLAVACKDDCMIAMLMHFGAESDCVETQEYLAANQQVLSKIKYS